MKDSSSYKEIYDVEKIPGGRITLTPNVRKTMDEYVDALLSKECISEIWNHLAESTANR